MYLKKLPKVKNPPIGENLPNLVTLERKKTIKRKKEKE
jgi:hypothetical protein